MLLDDPHCLNKNIKINLHNEDEFLRPSHILRDELKIIGIWQAIDANLIWTNNNFWKTEIFYSKVFCLL